MRSLLLWPFAEALRRLGFEVPITPENTLALVRELTGEDLTDTERLSHRHARVLLDWAVAIAGREDLGVLAAEAVEPGHFELVELASRAQRTVGEALTTLSSLIAILHDGLALKLVRGPQVSRVRISITDGLELHPAVYDYILATLIIAGRRQTRIDDLSPRCVRLQSPAPSDPSVPHALQRIIACPIEYGSDSVEIEFDNAVLDLPLVRADASIGEALRGVGQDLLAKDGDRRLSVPVRAHVCKQLGSGAVVDAATLARALHMSERTLRRKLDAEGVGLRALIDDVRRELALERLSDPALSTEAIAAQLGFSTAQAFHRAFRRWTGSTVQAHRAKRK